MKDGLVIDHAKELELYDCEFRVREAGRRKVIREGRKNVHAFVVGTLISKSNKSGKGAAESGYYKPRVSYNPYKRNCFYLESSNERVVRANSVYFYHDKVVTVNGYL